MCFFVFAKMKLAVCGQPRETIKIFLVCAKNTQVRLFYFLFLLGLVQVCTGGVVCVCVNRCIFSHVSLYIYIYFYKGASVLKNKSSLVTGCRNLSDFA